jgi:chromosome segregation ATPase
MQREGKDLLIQLEGVRAENRTLASYRERVTELESQLSVKERDLRTLRLQLQSKTDEYSTLTRESVPRTQFDDVTDECRKRKLDIDLLVHRIKELESADVVPRHAFDALTHELTIRQTVIRDKDEQISARDATLAVKEKELARLSRDLVARAEYDAVRDQLARAERELVQRDKQLQYANEKIDKSRESEAAYRQQCVVLDTDVRQKDSELKHYQSALVSARDECARRIEELTTATLKIRELTENVKRLEDEAHGTCLSARTSVSLI